ncbi:MAG: type II secretion system minor pseudopilin GspK [Candidatus Binatus sp.]|jgi:general secretion pathway protein K|uniref:type II secretion system minor pseudopilin GspK n=1 Tax=Candidatus Binatus sp. TaxID=2811406 RepID=UPI003D09C63F
MRRSNERGVAILAVLLGIALMTLIVVDFAMTSGLGFVSAANQANELRAGYLARSGISMGLALLAADARSDAQSKTPTDTLSDVWAVPFPPMDVEGGNVSLSIVDEARKLPINLMVNQGGAPNQAAIAKMQRLFTILDVNTDLIQGIIQWISPNGANGAGGDSFYAGLIPPYAPRNGPMPTIADLQMVEGFNQAIFNRVSPFLTVMPETAVNANTASPQVLAALEPQWTEDQKVVQQIVEARTIRPFTQPTDIMNLLGTSAPPTLAHDVTMRSQFFTVVGTGTYAGARKIITATFQRQTSGVGMLAAWHED